MFFSNEQSFKGVIFISAKNIDKVDLDLDYSLKDLIAIQSKSDCHENPPTPLSPLPPNSPSTLS